ncbi:DNA uptake protein [Hyella patelloides LEGE 07179]|uniref:DNA uptake protein n=1 Tax=Hyella patelloides LEGE 07179 TaxID=945734 RepID=A0A563VMW6_9CYAN|nr:ComEA family DNA-binding protein [Hyella patelloides]VEP12752.1 DNA uptake protein [Hyella patelloides LEGE 07179]
MFHFQKIAIANKIRNDPFYRFQSLTEIEIAAKLGIKIDVNQANVDDWLRLPGISIHQAKVLVELVRRGVHLVCIEDVAATINIPVTRLLPFEPILYFAYYDRLSILSPQKINLNQASLAEIKQISLWDDNLANLVFEERETKGKYRNFADLQSRLDLGNELISKLIYDVEL